MSAKKYTLAHISDLHLSPEYFPERSARFRSILEQCIERKVDHIIISGDLTNQAKTNELEHFREIMNEYSFLDGKKSTVVIGNHDIFGGPYHAEDVLEFPSMCKATLYDHKVNEFYNHTRETFSGVKFLSDRSAFPFVKTINDIALIGINSVAPWSALKNPLGSNGAVEDRQFQQIESLLKSTVLEGKRIFIIVHHHFHKIEYDDSRSKLERLWMAIEASTMKLRKKKRLLKLFSRSGVEGILHGHVHRNDEYFRKKVRCFNAGGSVIPSKNSQKLFNIITVKPNGIDVSVVPPLQLNNSHSKTQINQKNRSLAAA